MLLYPLVLLGIQIKLVSLKKENPFNLVKVNNILVWLVPFFHSEIVFIPYYDDCHVNKYLVYQLHDIQRQCHVYHTYFKKVITNTSTYAPPFFSLICEVSFHLMEMNFCYSVLKRSCIVTMEHQNNPNMMKHAQFIIIIPYQYIMPSLLCLSICILKWI